VKAIKKEFKESEEYKERSEERPVGRKTFGELSRVAWRRRTCRAVGLAKADLSRRRLGGGGN